MLDHSCLGYVEMRKCQHYNPGLLDLWKNSGGSVGTKTCFIGGVGMWAAKKLLRIPAVYMRESTCAVEVGISRIIHRSWQEIRKSVTCQFHFFRSYEFRYCLHLPSIL